MNHTGRGASWLYRSVLAVKQLILLSGQVGRDQEKRFATDRFVARCQELINHPATVIPLHQADRCAFRFPYRVDSHAPLGNFLSIAENTVSLALTFIQKFLAVLDG